MTDEDLNYRIKRLEQRQEVQMKSFRDQLKRLSSEYENIKKLLSIHSQNLLSLTLYFAALEANVKSIADTLEIDIDDLDELK